MPDDETPDFLDEIGVLPDPFLPPEPAPRTARPFRTPRSGHIHSITLTLAMQLANRLIGDISGRSTVPARRLAEAKDKLLTTRKLVRSMSDYIESILTMLKTESGVQLTQVAANTKMFSGIMPNDLNRLDTSVMHARMAIESAIPALESMCIVDDELRKFVIDDIMALPNSFADAYYSSHYDYLTVVTEPITLTLDNDLCRVSMPDWIYLQAHKELSQLSVDIGRLTISFDLGGTTKKPADRIIVGAVNYQQRLGLPHPHAKNTSTCLGEATGPVNSFVSELKILDLFTVVESAMQSYNPDSSFMPLCRWVDDSTPCSSCRRLTTDDARKDPCADCGSKNTCLDCNDRGHKLPECLECGAVCCMTSGCSNYVIRCQNTKRCGGAGLCKNCYVSCLSCKSRMCPDCSSVQTGCPACNKPMCPVCTHQCISCGVASCKACAYSATCMRCRITQCEACVKIGYCIRCETIAYAQSRGSENTKYHSHKSQTASIVMSINP